MSKHDAFFSEPFNVRRFTSHYTEGIRTDIGLADIIAPDDDIGLTCFVSVGALIMGSLNQSNV